MPSTPSRVSVLLPCRDAERYLPAAIASIEKQTLGDFEVLAVDDGSVDGTRDMLKAWAARDRRVRVLEIPRSGLVRALEAAREAAHGEFIARMDADDVAHPRRFEMQVALMDARPDIGACGTRIRYFPRRRVKAGGRRYEHWINGLTEPDAIARDVFVECPIPHPTLVVRRALLEEVGGWRDAGWPEDYDLILRLWQTGRPLAKVPRVLLRWRERPDRLSRTAPAYSHAAFRRCRATFLLETLVRGRPLLVAGSGPSGKLFAREAMRMGARLAAFVDVDPRKVGQTVHGVPVVRPDAIAGYRGAFGVAAVADARAREQIRTDFRRAGWVELEEYAAVA